MRALIVTEADFANLSLLRAPPKALQRALADAQIVSSDNVPPEILTMNSQAILGDASGSRRLVTLVYPADASAAQGRIAVTEALGTALLGASPGQMIDDGEQRLRVEKVLHQPERSLRQHLVLRGS